MRKLMALMFLFFSLPVFAENLFNVIPGRGKIVSQSLVFEGILSEERVFEEGIVVHESTVLASEFNVEFGGKNHVALGKDIEWRSGGDFLRTFRVEDSPNLSFITRHDGYFYGLVSLETGELLEIRPDAEGQVLQQQIGPSSLHCETVAGPLVSAALVPQTNAVSSKRRAVKQGPKPPVQLPSAVSVAVLYDDDAMNAVGGLTQVQTIAQGAVDAHNLARRNSLVSEVLLYAGLRHINFTESGSGKADLGSLAQNTEAQQARKDLNASTVLLLTKEGIVISFVPLGGNFSPDTGFSILGIKGPSFGYYAAHELAHPFGCQHDEANAIHISNDPYSKARGNQYCGTGGQWQTVMSYGTECTHPPGQNPAYLMYFSNPDVSIGGVPTGIANKADNADMLRIGTEKLKTYPGIITNSN